MQLGAIATIGSFIPRLPVNSSSVVLDRKDLSATEKNDEYRRIYGYQDKDVIQVYTLPKGKAGKLCSFSYKPMSAKVNQLQQTANTLKSKITALQYSDLSYGDKMKKIECLRGQLKYTNSRISFETDALPTYVVIVEESE